MYRCYLIHHGRIAKAIELAAATLEDAIAQGRALLLAQPETTEHSGIEIWQRADLLHSDQRHAHDTGISAPIVSPFETRESTTLPTTKPSRSRLLYMMMFG